MIYLKNNTAAQVAMVPNNGLTAPGVPATFSLWSTVEHHVRLHEQDVVVDSDSLYIPVTVTLPDGLPVGEYRYELAQAGEMLSEGLITVGDYSRATRNAQSGGVTFAQGR